MGHKIRKGKQRQARIQSNDDELFKSYMRMQIEKANSKIEYNVGKMNIWNVGEREITSVQRTPYYCDQVWLETGWQDNIRRTQADSNCGVRYERMGCLSIMYCCLRSYEAVVSMAWTERFTITTEA